jgi:toxin ParE1/3/4
MPLVPLTLSSQAHVDLARIWAYIAEDSISAADRLNSRFAATFRRLQRFPELGETCRYRCGAFRRFAVGNYVVFYQFTLGEIKVARVFHAAQNWEELL